MGDYTEFFKRAFIDALNTAGDEGHATFCRAIIHNFFIQRGLDEGSAILATNVWASAARRQYKDHGARLPAAVLKVMVDLDVDTKAVLRELTEEYDNKLLMPFVVESGSVKKLK